MTFPLRRLGLVLVVVALGAADPADPADPTDPESAPTPTATPIPGTHLDAIVPESFTAATGFPGLEHAFANTSVVVTEIPRSLEEVSEWVDADVLEKRGLKRVAAEDLMLDDVEASIFSIEDDRGDVDLFRWILLFGSSEQTEMVVATTQSNLEPRLRGDVRALLQSVRWNRERRVDPFDGLGFRVDATPRLLFQPRLSDRVVLIRQDQIGPVAGADPRVFVTQHELAMPVDDLARYASEHLMLSDQTAVLENVSERALNLAGLDAFEIVAHGQAFEGLSPLVVYQVLALDGDSYYVVQAFAARQDEQRYLAEFRQVAKSFRRAR